ncbi:MAG: serine/threonine-protein kinase [Candidatus Ratteibacteria bacterium]|jgi:serine/threonine protein kinase
MIRNFSDYILEEKVGNGAFSTVYRARSFVNNPPYGKVVAVKLLNEKIIAAEEHKVIRQFTREADISMKLNHENIIRVFTWGRHNGRYALVMEYVDGTNLYEFIHRPEKFSFQTLLAAVIKIGKGLIYIHKNGIVHKDIKPENVLVSGDLNVVKITDFGIAKMPKKWWQRDIFGKAGSERRFSHISYAAPEQKRGHSTHLSDIYSFGVLMDELFLTKMTLEGKDEQDYFRRISNVVFKYRKTQEILSEFLPMPEGLKELLRKACKENPSDRFQDVSEFVSGLVSFLDSSSSLLH